MRSHSFGAAGSRAYRALVERALEPLYREIAGSLPDARVVLDLGCGTAALTLLLARARPAATFLGVDAEREMLRQAGERGRTLPNLRLARADGRELPLRTASIDLVLASLSMHHWEAPVEVLREARRVLRPGGLLLAFEPDPEATDDAWRTGLAPVAGLRIPPWLIRLVLPRHGFTAEDCDTAVTGWAREAGFAGLRHGPFLWCRRIELARGSEPWTGEVAEETVRIPIEDALDLHAFRPDETAAACEAYLDEARAAGFREVRLIHGRGIGVQREIVRKVCARHPAVVSFADAPPERGGWGATVVTLLPDIGRN